MSGQIWLWTDIICQQEAYQLKASVLGQGAMPASAQSARISEFSC